MSLIVLFFNIHLASYPSLNELFMLNSIIFMLLFTLCLVN